MSRIRGVNISDANGDPIILNDTRVPVYMDDREVNTTIQDGAQIDAFARLRVSNPTTIFDNTFQYDLSPIKFSNNLTGTAAITHLPNESAAQLSTGGTASGAKAVLQTKRYVRYQPGKSQLILLTGVLGDAKANVRQRIGYFDDDNGLFFEQTETAKSVNVRTFTSGSAATTSILQADWNIDKLDGTGVSGITLDFSMSHIFLIDFEWLGVGRVRFGFVIDGMPVYCHEVLNANNLATVYMTTPHLPLRASIENTGTAASATTMKQFCMAVASEGGLQEGISYPFGIGRAVTSLSVTTRRPVLSIRPRTTFNSITNRGHITYQSHEIIAESNPCRWEIVLNGSLTGVSWVNVDTTNSIADYDTASTAITGGLTIATGFATAGGGTGSNTIFSRALSDALQSFEIYNNFAGTTPDVLSLVITSISATSNINACINWTEQR